MPATSGLPAEGAGAPAAAAQPAALAAAQPGTRWRQVFPGDQPQLAVMRRWLNSVLPDCPERGDVVSVATELGTNAVLHTETGRGGWFAVEITWYGAVMRVAVADCGGPGEPQVIEHVQGEHGRGLALVRGLAIRLGFQGDQHGRVVWADVPWGRSSLQAPAQGQSRPLAQPAAHSEPVHHGTNGFHYPEAASLGA
jgi:anti-sigma regulatory factor (Ser/Thr protein kinase)